MDMKKLLEAITKFAGEPAQKPGDQVKGTDKAKSKGNEHPFKGKLVGASESIIHDLEKVTEEKSLEWQLAEEFAQFKETYEEKIYPDTRAGVLQFIKDEIDPGHVATELKPEECEISPDPSVEGVWLVENPNTGFGAIIYMAGYKDPWGSIRQSNDFESLYPEEDLHETVDTLDVDEQLTSLRNAYRTLIANKDSYSELSLKQASAVYEQLRSALMKGDLDEYKNVYNHVSGKYTDGFDLLMDIVIEQGGRLFEENFGINPRRAARKGARPSRGHNVNQDGQKSVLEDELEEARDRDSEYNANMYLSRSFDKMQPGHYLKRGEQVLPTRYATSDAAYKAWQSMPERDRAGVKIHQIKEGGLVKNIKRKLTGKDLKSRTSQEIGKSFDAMMSGDNKTAKKHFRNFDRLDSLRDVKEAKKATPAAYDVYADADETIEFCLSEYFGGKAWFKGGSYAYLMDLSKPNIIASSDGGSVQVQSFAHGIDDYADKWVADDFFDAVKKYSWDEELAKEFFRPANSMRGQADYERDMMEEGWESGPDERVRRERDPDAWKDNEDRPRLNKKEPIRIKAGEEYWDPKTNTVRSVKTKEVIRKVDEGYTVVPDINRERYTDLSHEGLEGPYRLESGKVVYYDPREGRYYDRDSDMYLSHEEADAHRSGSVYEDGTTDPRWEKLRNAYSALKGIDPASPTYLKLIKFLDGLSTEDLQSLADANIKFVSGLARNRVNRRAMNMKESRGHKIVAKKLKDIEARNKPVSDEEHAKHIASLKKQRAEYVKSNPKSIYKQVDEYGASAGGSAAQTTGGGGGSVNAKSSNPEATAATTALKAATGSTAPAPQLAKAIDAASKGQAMSTTDAKTLEPLMKDVASLAQNPDLANQFKPIAQKAKQFQQTQQQQAQQTIRQK